MYRSFSYSFVLTRNARSCSERTFKSVLYHTPPTTRLVGSVMSLYCGCGPVSRPLRRSDTTRTIQNKIAYIKKYKLENNFYSTLRLNINPLYTRETLYIFLYLEPQVVISFGDNIR